MLNFLDIEKFTKSLTPVTNSEILSKTGDFSDDGLFSETIFGNLETIHRRQTFSYIDLNCNVIHPTGLKILIQLDRKVEKFISTENSFSLDENKRLIVDENGVTGIEAFIELFPRIKFRGETETREKYIQLIKNSYSNKRLFINKIPVIPPEFRPAYKDESGMWIIDELNNVYISIIRRAEQIKSSGSGPLFDLLNYSMQKSVNEHDSFIKLKVSKKHGLIRQNLLGKRVDFSTRAVIAPGPELKTNEVGIPFRIAVTLFNPFIIHIILYTDRFDKKELDNQIQDFLGVPLSVDTLQQVLKNIKNNDEIPETLYNIIWDATELAMMNRYVICKRDPVLHAESLRGMKPKLVDGDVIKVSTVQVGGFNADFDGDQMAIYHPITDKAQKEIQERMMNGKTGVSSNSINYSISKEMCVGLYFMTKDVSLKGPFLSVLDDDLQTRTDIYSPVNYRGVNTSLGKAIFNSCLPEKYPFVNQVVTKSIANNIISDIVDKFNDEEGQKAIYKMKNFAFKFSTIMAPSIRLSDIQVPDQIYELKKDLEDADPDKAQELLDAMLKILKDYLKDTGLYAIVESGAGKGWNGPMQILVAKGIIKDPKGNILKPIKGSFSDGLSPEEYFKASPGGRAGIIDRVLNTADTGYMSRKLAYVLNNVELSQSNKDCGTKDTLTIKLDKYLISRIDGRYYVNNKGKLELFDKSKFKSGDMIKLRSPIFCESKKICHTCYGNLLLRHKSRFVGILAAQVIGEVGTQLIMRTFHTGGAVKLQSRQLINDIIDNDPLVTENTVRNKLVQNETQLITQQDCKLIIDLNSYEIDTDLTIDEIEKTIWVKSLICRIEYQDVTFNIILDYPIELKAMDMIKHGKFYIELTFKKGEIILEGASGADDLKKEVHFIERLLGGKEIFKDTQHLFKKLSHVYFSKSKMDSVHLEILLSNVLRCRRDLSLPARLCKPFNPVMTNIKNIVFSTSFIQGLAFENIGKAISTGLIADTVDEPSILEQVLTGEFK